MSERIPSWPAQSSADFVDELLRFMEREGAVRYDEEVTQLEHALQTAHLAVRARASECEVAAALLHDLGHLLLGAREERAKIEQTDLEHEEVGARWLAQMFPPAVTGPVREHVRAKRYLCTVDTGYFNRLSQASVHSYELQGGLLSKAEREQAESLPYLQAALNLRRRDDGGKVPGKSVPGLEDYRELLESLILR